MRSTAVVAAVGALVLAGGAFAGGAAVGAHARDGRAQQPLLPPPTVALSSSSVPTGERVESPRDRCPAFAYSVPAGAQSAGAAGFELPGAGAVVVTCLGDAETFGGMDGLLELKTADPAATGLVAAPLFVTGPMGTALRTEARLSRQDLTEWFMVHDGAVVGLGYVQARGAAETDGLSVPEAVLASWEWR